MIFFENLEKNRTNLIKSNHHKQALTSLSKIHSKNQGENSKNLLFKYQLKLRINDRRKRIFSCLKNDSKEIKNSKQRKFLDIEYFFFLVYIKV